MRRTTGYDPSRRPRRSATGSDTKHSPHSRHAVRPAPARPRRGATPLDGPPWAATSAAAIRASRSSRGASASRRWRGCGLGLQALFPLTESACQRPRPDPAGGRYRCGRAEPHPQVRRSVTPPAAATPGARPATADAQAAAQAPAPPQAAPPTAEGDRAPGLPRLPALLRSRRLRHRRRPAQPKPNVRRPPADRSASRPWPRSAPARPARRLLRTPPSSRRPGSRAAGPGGRPGFQAAGGTGGSSCGPLRQWSV